MKATQIRVSANRRFPVLSAILGILILVALLQTGSFADSLIRPQFSSEDLIKGIFFGQKPVVDKLPVIDGLFNLISEQERVEAAAHADEVLAEIRQSKPGFLDRFATEIQSGDHIRVRDALGEGAELVSIALRGDVDLASLNGGLASADYTCVIVVVVVIAWAIAFVAVALDYALAAIAQVAVLANVAYAVTVVHTEPSPASQEPAASSLVGDLLVDQIATSIP